MFPRSCQRYEKNQSLSDKPENPVDVLQDIAIRKL